MEQKQMILETETERLRMRQWKSSDFEPFAQYFTLEDQARFIGGACARPDAWRRMATIIGHWTIRGFGFYAVDEKETGHFVGCIGLWMPEGWPELEVGYWLMPEAQGKGYATEAVRHVRLLAKQHLGANEIVSYIHPQNIASQMVAERVGAFHEETINLANFGPHRSYRHPKV